METNSDRIKDKIRKLLTLGEDDGATEAEAENALRFARRLMLKHNVSEKDMEETKDVHEIAADVEHTTFGQVRTTSQGSTLTKWEVSLGWAVMELIGTVRWYRAGETERRTKAGVLEFNEVTGAPKICQVIMFYGPEEDCRDARELMQEWSLTIIALARMRFGGALRGDGRSYCEGFCDALYSKVSQIRREERKLIDAQKAQQALPEGATRSTALMVLNGTQLMEAKREHASKWLEKEIGIKLRSSGSSGRGGSFNGDAYAAGAKDGKSADFSHKRTKKLGGGS